MTNATTSKDPRNLSDETMARVIRETVTSKKKALIASTMVQHNADIARADPNGGPRLERLCKAYAFLRQAGGHTRGLKVSGKAFRDAVENAAAALTGA